MEENEMSNIEFHNEEAWTQSDFITEQHSMADVKMVD